VSSCTPKSETEKSFKQAEGILLFDPETEKVVDRKITSH
jgi:hypothetical protein